MSHLPLIYRNDGFSLFGIPDPPLTREILLERFVDPLEGSNVEILEWGVGPGSVFCYDTKVGQIFGEPLNDQQWTLMREYDRRVHANVMSLVDAGSDPLEAVVERAHGHGLRVFARLEMNHEYGPVSESNWTWVGFVGAFNKEHPQYRIPGSVHLDFAHPEVRDFKLSILREVVDRGCDGVSLDFMVYPPHFEEPDCEAMTELVREVRALAVDVLVRVPVNGGVEMGLDWRTWVAEGLVDVVVPWRMPEGQQFAPDISEQIEATQGKACRVFGCIRPNCGFVTTDRTPTDEKKGTKHDKEKTRGMYNAQALLFHRAGADGIQLAMGADEWSRLGWFDHLADGAYLETADKHYMVDIEPHLPVELDVEHPAAVVPLRVADDVTAVVEAELLLYHRRLEPDERLVVGVNGAQGVLVQEAGIGGSEEPVGFDQQRKASFLYDESGEGDSSVLFDPEWWRRGEHRVPIHPGALRQGVNEIGLRFDGGSAPLSIVWIDLLLTYF